MKANIPHANRATLYGEAVSGKIMTQRSFKSIKIKYSRLKIYLLNYFFLFGLIFFIGGLLGAIEVSGTFYSNQVDLDNLDKSSVGQIVSFEKIIPTSGEGDGSPYYKYKYYFNSGEKKIIGKGYSDNEIYKLNDSLTIFYNSQNPQESKATNLRESKYEKGDTIAIWILPILGLVVLFISFQWSKNIIQLLDNATITMGKYFKSSKSDDNDGFYNHYVFKDNKGLVRVVKEFSSWYNEKETIVVFDSTDKSNHMTINQLVFFGSKTIKEQINSAANRIGG